MLFVVWLSFVVAVFVVRCSRVVVCCWLFVVCSPLCVDVRCWSFVVCCLLFVVCCLKVVVGSVLFEVCGLWFVVTCCMFVFFSDVIWLLVVRCSLC